MTLRYFQGGYFQILNATLESLNQYRFRVRSCSLSYGDTTLPPSGGKGLLQCFKTTLYFFPLASQNGQTALSVAEGGSHQDILDLLKAGSQPPSAPDLL